MKKTVGVKRIYEVISVIMIFPVLVLFVISIFDVLANSVVKNPEKYDAQVQGFVVDSEVERSAGKGSYEDGGSITVYITVQYEVNGTYYTSRQSAGSTMEEGSLINVSYDSSNPQNCIFVDNPAAASKRVSILAIISGICLVVFGTGTVLFIVNNKKEKKTKMNGN